MRYNKYEIKYKRGTAQKDSIDEQDDLLLLLFLITKAAIFSHSMTFLPAAITLTASAGMV